MTVGDFPGEENCPVCMEIYADNIFGGAYVWGWYDYEKDCEYYFLDTAGLFVVC
jgi:hypothetical protein